MALYYAPTQNGLQKSLDATLSQGATSSATLNNVTGIQNKAGVFVVNRINSAGTELDTSVREYISFTGVSGSTVTTLTRGLAGSSDQEHAVGSVVEFVPDVIWAGGIMDALDNAFTSAGALDTTKVVDLTTAQTLSSKTLTSPTSSNPTDTGTATTPIIQGSASAANFPQIKGVNAIGAAGSTETIDWTDGDRQYLTLDENITITFSNPKEGQVLTLYMLQDGSGTNTITFADSITWASNTTPTWTTTASKMNIAVISYVGAAYYGVGNAFA